MILAGALVPATAAVLSLLSWLVDVAPNFVGELEADEVTKRLVTLESLTFLAHLEYTREAISD